MKNYKVIMRNGEGIVKVIVQSEQNIEFYDIIDRRNYSRRIWLCGSDVYVKFRGKFHYVSVYDMVGKWHPVVSMPYEEVSKDRATAVAAGIIMNHKGGKFENLFSRDRSWLRAYAVLNRHAESWREVKQFVDKLLSDDAC